MPDRILIYGATGYTGKLVAEAAKAKGFHPIVAGRNGAKVRSVAGQYGFESVTLELSDGVALERALRDVDVVLHIAGPFSHTSAPMVDACLKTKTHYLDITGEIDVFEACAARDAEAKAQGVMLLPGCGFDVVPSDCLIAHAKERMPDATSIEVGIAGLNSLSRGTAKTGVESIGKGTMVRRGGKIVPAGKTPVRDFDYLNGNGPTKSVAVGWGDVSTGFHSTGIEDITIYFEATPQMEQLASLGSFMRFVLSTGPVQGFLKSRIDKQPEGPDEAQRAQSQGILIAETRNAAGEMMRSRLTTPDGYTLTALTALEIVSRVMAGGAKPGFQTPSSAFGSDFIRDFDGCVMDDLNDV